MPRTRMRHSMNDLCDSAPFDREERHHGAVRCHTETRSDGVVRAVAVCLIATLELGACAAPSDPDNRATITDSAGVTLVDLPSTAAAPTDVLALSSEPLLTVGVEQGDPVREFDRIAVVRFLDDHVVAVANRGSSDVRLFGPDGTYLRTLGRTGEGPGEFASLNWMQAFVGDTIAVLDSQLRRVTTFDADGNLIAVTTFPDAEGYAWPRDFRMPGGGFVMFWDVNSLFDRINAGEVHVGETARVDMPMVRLDASGSPVDTIGVFAGAEYAVVSSDGRVGITDPPLGRFVSHAFDRTGVWIGTQEAFDIAHYTFDGRLTHRLRDLSMDLTFDEDDLLEFAASLADRQNADAARRAAIEKRVLELPRPATRAAHGEIRVAPGGEVWVAEAVAPVLTPSFWTVIDPATGAVARVLMPEGFQLHDVSADRVAGVFTDELDVQRVRVLELVR